MHWMESLKNGKCALETEAKKVYCNPSQSFFKFAHPFLLLYMLCYLHLLFMFWAVIFMFHSVWWRFLRFALWLISWHSFFTLYVVPTARWFRFYRLCYTMRMCVMQEQLYTITIVYIVFSLTQTCQPTKGKKRAILNQELENVVRNWLKFVRCPKFPSGRTFSGDYGYLEVTSWSSRHRCFTIWVV